MRNNSNYNNTITMNMNEEEGKMKGADVRMIIHPPIPTDNLTKEEERDLSDVVENIVREGVARLQSEDEN